MIDEKELIKELSRNSIFEKITIGEETVFDIINRLPKVCVELKFKTTQEMAKEIAEKAFDEYEYEGKSIRQWVEVLKDYEDKQTTLERIVKRLENKINPLHNVNWNAAMEKAIEIVKEEGGLNE